MPRSQFTVDVDEPGSGCFVIRHPFSRAYRSAGGRGTGGFASISAAVGSCYPPNRPFTNGGSVPPIRATANSTALTLVGLAVLATGCEPADRAAEKEVAATASATASPTGGASPSAGPTASPTPVAVANTREVCAAVTTTFVNGSRKIADDSYASIEKHYTLSQVNTQLRKNLAAIAAGLRKQAARATDPAIKALIGQWAASLEKGARATDPTAYTSKELVKIGTAIDEKCQA